MKLKTIKRLWTIRQFHKHMYYMTFGGTPKKDIPISRYYKAALQHFKRQQVK